MLSRLLKEMKAEVQRRNVWKFACFAVILGNREAFTDEGEVIIKLDAWVTWEAIATRESWLEINQDKESQ